MIIDKMNQAAKDREVEFRVSGKKNDQLVRNLFIKVCLVLFLLFLLRKSIYTEAELVLNSW